jgi:hypothetical protein
MSKLHELLAVMADSTNAAAAIKAETENTFTKKPDHFKGLSRAMSFLDEARSSGNATDRKEMVTTVGDKLDYTFAVIGGNYDALLQLEATNQNANAALVIDGVVLAAGVPATFLLGMETRLKALRDTLLLVPTLDPSIRWEADAVAGEGVWRSDVQTAFRTEKTLKHKVLYEATPEHPAQIEMWHEDRPIAKVETTHTSGAITPSEKSAMLDRISKLIVAVKTARQRANTTEVVKGKIASTLFDYIRGTA